MKMEKGGSTVERELREVCFGIGNGVKGKRKVMSVEVTRENMHEERKL